MEHRIDAPRLPAQAPYGLLASVVPVVDGSDVETLADGTVVKWTQGFAYRPEDCDGGSWVDACTFGSAGNGGADPTGDKAAVRIYRPLAAEASVICSTFGSLAAEEDARARRKLLAVASKLLEAELWTGAEADTFGYTTNPRLADAAATSLGTLGYEVALAELEQALADALSSQRRMIHAQPRVVTAWAAANLLDIRGNVLTTKLGTIVVPGAGYPGTGPAGEPADKDNSYAYGTSMVDVRLGEIWSPTIDLAAVDRDTNTRLHRYYRPVAATWDGCAHVVVNVNLATARAMS
jgi:hypothetical protein